VLNLSAPFIPQFFKIQLEQVLQYTDILIGNKDEAETWATAQGFPTTDLAEIAERVAKLPKSNSSRDRTVIFTQGAGETIVATSEGTARYPVPPLKHDIVDSNAAGDAFAGGVLASLVLGKGLPVAIQVGHKMGAMCLAHDGAQFAWPKVNVL
jgi:adenosine kinase